MQLGRGGRAGAQQADGGEAADPPGGGETPARPTEPSKGQVLAPASPPALASEAPCPSPGSQEESAGPEETGAGRGGPAAATRPRGHAHFQPLSGVGLACPPNSAVTATVPQATPSGSPCRLKMKPSPRHQLPTAALVSAAPAPSLSTQLQACP